MKIASLYQAETGLIDRTCSASCELTVYQRMSEFCSTVYTAAISVHDTDARNKWRLGLFTYRQLNGIDEGC